MSLAEHFSVEELEHALRASPDEGFALRLVAGDSVGPQVIELATSPALSSVVRLYVMAGQSERGAGQAPWLEALFTSPHLGPLEHLTLHDGDLDASVHSLAACAALASLRELNLLYTHLSPAGIGQIAASPHLRGVRDLDLEGNGLGDDGVLELCSGGLQDLRHLGLGVNWITPVGVALLADSSLARGLEVLDLNENKIGLQGARVLASAEAFAHLERLDVYESEIGYDGLDRLCESRTLSRTVVQTYRRLREDDDAFYLI